MVHIHCVQDEVLVIQTGRATTDRVGGGRSKEVTFKLTLQ